MPRADVRDDDPAGRPHPAGEPGGHRAGSAPDFQAVPAVGRAQRIEMPRTDRVVEGVEPPVHLGRRVVEDVLGHSNALRTEIHALFDVPWEYVACQWWSVQGRSVDELGSKRPDNRHYRIPPRT
jgi:hypothetical protein